MKIKLISLIIILCFVLISSNADAKTCPFCHATGISSLAMICPECSKNLHDIKTSLLEKKEAGLIVRIFYTGNAANSIPEYAKLYINGKYKGNVTLKEKETTLNGLTQTWSTGLGKDFTALYEKKLTNVSPGVLRVEVKMKFKRLYGFGRSYKTVTFPYVSFQANKKTTISHYFNSAATFNKYKPEKRKKIPVISDMKIQGAKGNLALNVPLFK